MNGAVVFPGASVEFVLRRALETDRPVFIGFVADLDARVHVLDKLDEAVADLCVKMILADASRKPRAVRVEAARWLEKLAQKLTERINDHVKDIAAAKELVGGNATPDDDLDKDLPPDNMDERDVRSLHFGQFNIEVVEHRRRTGAHAAGAALHAASERAKWIWRTCRLWQCS